MSEVDCRVRPSEWLCATGVLRLFGGFELAVAVCDCLLLGSGCGLVSGRQAAWRPGCSWLVSLELVGGTSGSCRDR